MIILFTFPEHLKMFMEFLQEPGEKKISKKNVAKSHLFQLCHIFLLMRCLCDNRIIFRSSIPK